MGRARRADCSTIRCLPGKRHPENRHGHRLCLLRRSGRAQGNGRRHGAPPPGQRQGAAAHAHLRHHDRATAGVGRLVGSGRRDPPGHGIDRGLLEADLEPAGGPLRNLVGQRPAHQARAGAQDRRPGQRMDRAVAAVRFAARQLRAADAAAGAARADPPAAAVGAGQGVGGQPHPEGARGRQH
jgi:hypothetical protein